MGYIRRFWGKIEGNVYFALIQWAVLGIGAAMIAYCVHLIQKFRHAPQQDSLGYIILAVLVFCALVLTVLFFMRSRKSEQTLNLNPAASPADLSPAEIPAAPLLVDLHGQILELYIQTFDSPLAVSKTYVLLKVRVVNHGPDEATLVACALKVSLGDFEITGEVQNQIPANWRIKRRRADSLSLVYDEVPIGDKLSAANVYKKGRPMVGWLLFETYIWGDRVFPNAQFDLALRDSFGNAHTITRKAGVYEQTGELIQLYQNHVPMGAP